MPTRAARHHSSAVEVDDVSTWPKSLRVTVAQVAPSFATKRHHSDIWLRDDQAGLIRRVLDGVDVLAYHATRLLEAEIAEIARSGVRLLDRALIEQKIGMAREGGFLTADEARVLLDKHAPIDGTAGVRAGQICVRVPRSALDTDPHGVLPLMSSWGGEAIYWAHQNTSLGEKLGQIGTPAVVAVVAPANGVGDHWFPDLPALLVAVELGLDDLVADVHLHTALPPGAIRGIWAPGHPEYDRYRHLPRA